jgi:hypothetical protein
VPGTPVTLTANATGGTAPFTYTFAQTAGPAQARTDTANASKFTPTLPPGTVAPATLTFTVTVKDAAARTATATINVFVGQDTITVTIATFAQRKSVLNVSASDNVAGGKAVLTLTPLNAAGQPIASGSVMLYDPTVNSYSSQPVTVNPIPQSIRITSSFGASITAPLTLIK